MIRRIKDLFILDTNNTTYCFRIMPSGHLEHLYYGRRIKPEAGYEPMIEKHRFLGGCELAYSEEFPRLGLEDVCLEMSSHGKGDIREAFIELIHADGGTTSDFLFRGAKLLTKKEALKTLPSAYLLEPKSISPEESADAAEKVISLAIELYDKNYDIALTLAYSVFEECDVITRSAIVVNASEAAARINRIMSGQLDFDTAAYNIRTFHGSWAREMEHHEVKASPGIWINDSKAGISSNRCNPFFIISGEQSSENYGACYGINLIYSGNHYAAAEVSSMGKLRVINGINPAGFSWLLQPSQAFEAPEAVYTYSDEGTGGMSRNMHRFIRNHIVRGIWKDKLRPILINSWEANYFKFNESKLLKQAKAAKEVGIELFVLDDGWFGRRNDDTSSLGDWTENREKLKNGLKGLAEAVNALGLDFGLWVEPEMVNEDSELYRLHPDWAVKIPGKGHSTGRNQMLLDLTREEVCSYIICEMTRVFSSANISYIKWDMNRIFSDCYSSSLLPEQQMEFGHRYMLGLYQILKTLTERFPKILFESCASGGNRFDLGMLCYMPQIWASDNTDAISRVAIQSGYSYGYPLSTIGAHVSASPNHQTLRNTSIETRFEVAAFGLLGYELNLAELSSWEKQEVARQIAFYKEHREVFQFGEFYRLRTNDAGIYQWISVASDQRKAVGLYLQKEVLPNYAYGKFQTKGLDDNRVYHMTNRQRIFNIKEFGDLINMISPIHIKQDSLAHNLLALVKKMPGEREDCIAYGDVFNHCGVKLKQGFAGTGYDEEVRLFQDNASRLYLWEEVQWDKSTSGDENKCREGKEDNYLEGAVDMAEK